VIRSGRAWRAGRPRVPADQQRQTGRAGPYLPSQVGIERTPSSNPPSSLLIILKVTSNTTPNAGVRGSSTTTGRADAPTLKAPLPGTFGVSTDPYSQVGQRSHRNPWDLRFSDRPHARSGEVFERRVIVIRIPCRVLGISMWNDRHHPLSSSS